MYGAVLLQRLRLKEQPGRADTVPQGHAAVARRAVAVGVHALHRALVPARRGSSLGRYHANLSPATRNWPFSVLGFWDKNNGIYAGAMPYRRDFPATTRI